MPYAVGPGGARLRYRVVGEHLAASSSPRNVVLIQGIGLSSRFWFEQPDLLAFDERAPRRVLLLDNRGAGGSDAPRGLYRMRHMADDVAAVMDAAGFDRADLVGISMGGMIAQHVALRHPSKVSGLVLLATTMGLPHGRLPSPRAIAQLLSLSLHPPSVTRALTKLLLPKRHVARAHELMSDWPAAFRAEKEMPARAFFGQFAAVAFHSTGFRLRRITCPTIVVTGDEDALIPAINSARIAKRIPNAHLEVLREVGHGIPLLDRDVVRRSLARLDALRGEAARAIESPRGFAPWPLETATSG